MYINVSAYSFHGNSWYMFAVDFHIHMSVHLIFWTSQPQFSKLAFFPKITVHKFLQHTAISQEHCIYQQRNQFLHQEISVSRHIFTNLSFAVYFCIKVETYLVTNQWQLANSFLEQVKAVFYYRIFKLTVINDVKACNT